MKLIKNKCRLSLNNGYRKSINILTILKNIKIFELLIMKFDI